MLNRLRLKITLGTGLILGGLLFLLGMYLVNSQEAQLKQNLRDHGNRIAALAARSSAEYIQRFSFFLMEDQAISIEQSPSIAFCEIYNTDGVSLLQSGNIASKDHDGKRTAHYGSDIIVVTQPIVASGGELLGAVEIGLRLDSIDAAIREKTTSMTMLFLGFTVFVIVVVNLFLNKLIIRPVLSLSDGAQRVANQEFLTLEEKGRSDEIGLLTRNFNQMSRALEELYANLERNVQERTRELEKANDDLKLAVGQARDMAEKAEAAALAKSRFIASMSHEIRTPMNAVLGMGNILNDSALDAEQKRYVRILLEAGHALLGLINDILDFSKIEAGEMAFENATFHLETVIDKAFKVTVYPGHRKGLDLDYAIAPGTPPVLLGDAMRLQQILINLIGNGIKFTDSGSVLLDVRSEPEPGLDDGTVMLHLCVRDTGVGIPADKLDTVFDTFTQADASTSRKHGGTGLGLSICRLLCEKLGGTIWVESEQGVGSAIHFRLPYRVEPADDESPPHAGRRVLLFDCRDHAEQTLGARMSSAGIQVDVASTPDAGDAFLAAGTAYDGLVVNVLSCAGKTDVLRELLEKHDVSTDRLVWLRSSDVSQAGNVPPEGVAVTMPASAQEIHAVLDRLLDRDRPAAGPDKRIQASGSSKPLNVLLVEDSETNSLLVELYFKDLDHRLIIASNGEDAYARFRREPIDIVFMDVEMPGMDGLECTRLLRQWEKDNGAPPARIVALTAHALVEIRQAAMAAGCDDFLTKPVTRGDLLQALENI